MEFGNHYPYFCLVPETNGLSVGDRCLVVMYPLIHMSDAYYYYCFAVL